MEHQAGSSVDLGMHSMPLTILSHQPIHEIRMLVVLQVGAYSRKPLHSVNNSRSHGFSVPYFPTNPFNEHDGIGDISTPINLISALLATDMSTPRRRGHGVGRQAERVRVRDGTEAVPVPRLLPPLLRRRQQRHGLGHGLQGACDASEQYRDWAALALLVMARDGVSDNVNVVLKDIVVQLNGEI